jgi:hypothetical protein
MVALAAVLVGFDPPRAAAQVCVGDCDGNGTVTISEVIVGVSIALGSRDVSACRPLANADGMVNITQLVQAVNNALNGCPCTDPGLPYRGPDGNCWSGPCSQVCPDGQTCCGGEFPYCGPDGNCWTVPCSNLCPTGGTCCGGEFPNCGPDGSCWTQPCVTLCGAGKNLTCCGPDQQCLRNGTCSH